jgi:type IV pilus assembly protein PilA
MLNTLKKRIKNEKGLSLVELLAVIVILAIVAAIAVPAIGNIIENSRYNAVKSDAINVLNAANLYFTDEPSKTTVTVSELKAANYLEGAGAFDKTENKGIEGTVTKGTGSSGNTFSTGKLKFSGDKTVTFSNATLNSVNTDSEKGSSISGDKTITPKVESESKGD